ncbi:transposase [Solibacillus sp. FSL H8-0523]|uniref:transposase n=1 Tax=Solibacillus sp. FSL H8-0523 TaxID=2954511 RepID=UPI00310148D2
MATEKGLKFVNYPTLCKRLGELNYLIVKRVFELIVGRLNRLPSVLYHGYRSGIKLHVRLTNTTGMPLQIVETTGLKHDDPIGVELKDKRLILVADRSYFSIDKADRYGSTKQDFVLRLKDNIQLNRQKPLKRTAVEGSNIVADFTCTLGTIKNTVFSQFLCATLPIERQIDLREILKFYRVLYQINTG